MSCSRKQRNFITTILCLISCAAVLVLVLSCTSTTTSGNDESGDGGEDFDISRERSFVSDEVASGVHRKRTLMMTEKLIDIDPEQLDYMNQEDPALWKYIRMHYMVPPSKKNYNLIDPKGNPGLVTENNPGGGQHLIVMKILNNMTKGFFVEAGAYDGEHYSNTLALERDLDWSGILIEGDPLIFPYLKNKHRKAWLSNACLSPSARPQLVEFHHANTYAIASRIGSPTNVVPNWTTFEVQCFPIYSILAAINVTVIDYFSLDVEGIEMKVLESIPFDRVFIKVFSVEWQLIPEGPKILKGFMLSKGYRLVTNTLIDFIFAHETILTKDTLNQQEETNRIFL